MFLKIVYWIYKTHCCTGPTTTVCKWGAER